MADPISPPADRLSALLGLVGVAGNVAGVLLLGDITGAYRPDQLDRWAALSVAHPQATVASAVAFILGLLALAGWASGLARRAPTPWARFGAGAITLGAALNAAGCVGPLVLVTHLLPGDAAGPAARALLGVALTLDALFNLLLGLGLLGLASALLGRGERGVGALGLLAGLASLPVAGQPFSAAAANLLAVAGPLWLAFVGWTSVRMWRGLRPLLP
jgi:hypothetical protein